MNTRYHEGDLVSNGTTLYQIDRVNLYTNDTIYACKRVHDGYISYFRARELRKATEDTVTVTQHIRMLK